MLYIYAKNNLTEIVCKKKVQKALKSPLSVVKGLCKRELFSYESRVNYTKQQLNIKSKIPVYINDKVLLMPTNSPKRYDTYWLNYYEVFTYEKHFNKTLVLFHNLEEIVVDVSYNSFKIMIGKGKLVADYFLKRLSFPLIWKYEKKCLFCDNTTINTFSFDFL